MRALPHRRKNAVPNFIPVGGSAFGALHVAGQTAVADIKSNRAVIVFETELRERKAKWFVIAARGGRQCGRKPALIKCSASRPSCRVAKYEFGSPLGCYAVPETIVSQPYRTARRMEYLRIGVVPHEKFGAGIVLGGERSRLRQTGKGES